MNDPRQRECTRNILLIARAMGLCAVGSAFAFVICHEPPAVVPEVIPSEGQYENMVAKVASAAALREMVDLVATLAIGLTATVAFGIKDGFGPNEYWNVTTTVLASLFIYFLFRVFFFSYYSNAAIAVQLEQGQIFVAMVEDLLAFQTRSLIYAAIIAALILLSRYAWTQR